MEKKVTVLNPQGVALEVTEGRAKVLTARGTHRYAKGAPKGSEVPEQPTSQPPAEDAYENMAYSQLQQLAKSRGLDAVGSAEKLRQRLRGEAE